MVVGGQVCNFDNYNTHEFILGTWHRRARSATRPAARYRCQVSKLKDEDKILPCHNPCGNSMPSQLGQRRFTYKCPKPIHFLLQLPVPQSLALPKKKPGTNPLFFFHFPLPQFPSLFNRSGYDRRYEYSGYYIFCIQKQCPCFQSSPPRLPRTTPKLKAIIFFCIYSKLFDFLIAVGRYHMFLT
uniref:Uncharacterized protein n=1 Tax=Manihot esculenta TaxID=3983 RepID=A0A2C9UDN1_MANES